MAAVLEAARVLSQYKFDNTIRYIGFNAGAKAFHGSDDYTFNVLGTKGEKFVGGVDLDQILHPYHDKKPALPQALQVGLAARTAAANAWATDFVATATQFVPALPLDPAGLSNDFASDHASFVYNGFFSDLSAFGKFGEGQSEHVFRQAR